LLLLLLLLLLSLDVVPKEPPLLPFADGSVMAEQQRAIMLALLLLLDCQHSPAVSTGAEAAIRPCSRHQAAGCSAGGAALLCLQGLECH
jgi:hypothetical protein